MDVRSMLNLAGLILRVVIPGGAAFLGSFAPGVSARWSCAFERCLLGICALGAMITSLSVAPVAAAAETSQPTSTTDSEEVPEGVQILMERGGIPAVFEPQFVPASEADLPEDAWIFGVVIHDQARAYSLNLLNRHEVVNDRIGETWFAAVW